MSFVQLQCPVVTMSLVADLPGSQALQRDSVRIRQWLVLLQSTFTLDWSTLGGGSWIFFCISCNILFAQFEVSYFQPSKIKLRELFKPIFALMYCKSSRGALYRMLNMFHCCQFCFPAARKEGFNQMRVPTRRGKSCSAFQQWAMPVCLGTVDSTSKGLRRPNRHILLHQPLPTNPC